MSYGYPERDESRWGPDDLAYSLRRYVSLALGPPWQIHLERREVRAEVRPLGRVEVGPQRATRVVAAVPQGPVEEAAPVTISLWPEAGENPREAGRRARAVRQLLFRVFIHGVRLPPHSVTGRPVSGPLRVPLWDYSEVPDSGGDGPVDPYDVVWIGEDVSVRDLRDPLDELRYAVVADLTASWEAPGTDYSEVDPDGNLYPKVTAVPGGWLPPPPP